MKNGTNTRRVTNDFLTKFMLQEEVHSSWLVIQLGLHHLVAKFKVIQGTLFCKILVYNTKLYCEIISQKSNSIFTVNTDKSIIISRRRNGTAL